LNLPSLTPAERKVALFTLLCALAGCVVLASKSFKPTPIAKANSQKEASVIRERLVKTDHSSAPRNRTGVELNLNTADEKDLARLPALGLALAHAVIQDRSAHGPYQSVSDLARVKGIGPGRLKSLSAFLYVLPQDEWASASTKSSQEKSR
jgi:competence ComEA-like helix-hairpin-helix protein